MGVVRAAGSRFPALSGEASVSSLFLVRLVLLTVESENVKPETVDVFFFGLFCDFEAFSGASDSLLKQS